jgi:hypothetical protein
MARILTCRYMAEMGSSDGTVELKGGRITDMVERRVGVESRLCCISVVFFFFFSEVNFYYFSFCFPHSS